MLLFQQIRNEDENMTITRNDELKYCTSIKAMLMLFVVFYHSMAMYGDGRWGPFQPAAEIPVLTPIVAWFNSFHIYAFTLISGYIFYHIKFENGRYQKYRSFLLNKAKRLLLPYAFVSIVWAVPVYIYFFGSGNVVDNFVLGKAPNQLWFLLMLFWVFAMIWPLSNLLDQKLIWGSAMIAILHCIGYIAPNFYCFGAGLQYLLFFYIGFVLRKLDFVEAILHKIPSCLYLLIDISLFALTWILRDKNELIIRIVRLGLNVVLHAVGAISAFIILQRVVHCFGRLRSMLSVLSKHSMSIYLIHQQLIYFSICLLNGMVSPCILILVNFVFSLLISLTFSILMSKSKFTKALLGS